jgi:nitrate reductase (cytochrome), electron transfer subunit
MKPGRPNLPGLVLGTFLLGSTVLAIVAISVAIKRTSVARAPQPQPVAVGIVAPPGQPIDAEAQVFRTRAGTTAIQPEARREREAHPRTLETFRYLRAYPGAPPRIPHGLTPTEFRTSACKTCHERGGYSRRFAAYVPVTPHPEMGMCLQCHVGEDALTGRPSSDPNSRCPQCHGSGGAPHPNVDPNMDWRTTAWPRLPPRAPDSTSPPPIPHDLQSRGNCLACHAGPAAVAEIRTRHPGRTDCRQCHVGPENDSAEFTRPLSQDGIAATGGVP